MLEVLTIAGIVAVAGLVWFLVRKHSQDQLDALLKQRSAQSRVADKAELAEGINRIPVVLSLSDSTIHYQNPDLDAQLEIARIEEVEYDDELATGTSIEHGTVLRLRSHGHAFEFILDKGAVQKWTDALPPHRLDDESELRVG